MYKYDNQNDRLYEGWPRKIREVFKGKTAEDTIPENLDTVFFDLRDKNMYFFKNDMVRARLRLCLTDHVIILHTSCVALRQQTTFFVTLRGLERHYKVQQIPVITVCLIKILI